MYIAINTGDRHPQIFLRKQHLFIEVSAFVYRQFDHSQFGFARRAVFVPGEVRLVGVGFGELLHAGVGFVVELELEVEGFGY